MKKTAGIILIYIAALAIMLSILLMFDVLPFGHAYTIAAAGFFLYVMGTLLSREGRFTLYKMIMIGVAVFLIVVAIIREIGGQGG